jgi:hypothetical protein
MSTAIARITVTRKDPRDVQDRQVVVSLDGKRFATLLYGKEVTREVPPGQHRLRAHNTLFWKTIDFDVAPGEHARFTAINRAGTGTFSMLGVLGVGPLFLTFEREPDPAGAQPSE